MPSNDNTHDNIVYLNVSTHEDISPNRVLDNAPRTLSSVFVLGWDADGEMYAKSSATSAEELLYLIERFKFGLFRGDFE
jgi:hypothetical protein